MSLINPVYVWFKYKDQELEGELIPFWSNYFDVDETKQSEEHIYHGYDYTNTDIQGYVRPFDSELRKEIIKFNTKGRGISFEKWCTRGDVKRRDALLTSEGSTDNALLISDVEFVYRKDLKSPKEEIEKCRQDMLDLYLLLLKSMCNDRRNIIKDKNKELNDLDRIYLGMRPTYKERISIVFKTTFWLAYFFGVYYGFMESISLGALWCIVGLFIIEYRETLEPVKRKKIEDSLKDIIERNSNELIELEEELEKFTGYIENCDKHSCPEKFRPIFNSYNNC